MAAQLEICMQMLHKQKISQIIEFNTDEHCLKQKFFIYANEDVFLKTFLK